MRILAALLLICTGAFTVFASDDLPYKTCEMKEDVDLACNARETMAQLVRAIGIGDKYTEEKLLESERCVWLYKSTISELRKYDSVKMSIPGENVIATVPISWVKVQLKDKAGLIDVFMVERFLKCK